jgi:hypothetical protein
LTFSPQRRINPAMPMPPFASDSLPRRRCPKRPPPRSSSPTFVEGTARH